MTTNENRAMSALYSIDTQTRQDISGTLTVDSLLIWKDVGMSGNKILTFEKASIDSVNLYFLVVDYLGQKWIFIDSLMLRIDGGNIITLRDENPIRDVDRRGNNVYVHEVFKTVISDEIVGQLRNCNNLVLQFEQSLITIPAEGMNAIKTFLNN
jgi:hypothetical protein